MPASKDLRAMPFPRHVLSSHQQRPSQGVVNESHTLSGRRERRLCGARPPRPVEKPASALGSSREQVDPRQRARAGSALTGLCSVSSNSYRASLAPSLPFLWDLSGSGVPSSHERRDVFPRAAHSVPGNRPESFASSPAARGLGFCPF